MNVSLLTYNTLFNKATGNLDTVIDQYHPDIICLQEAQTDAGNIKKIEDFGYKMADYANSFVKFRKIFGVVTLYNPKTIKYKDSLTLNLNTNVGEYFFYLLRIILGFNQPKTFLETTFVHKKTNLEIIICNVHLFVIGSNGLRIKDIDHALNALGLKKKKYFIIAGDFNYFPYLRKKLEKVMKKYQLKEATSKINQTIKFSDSGSFEKFNLFQKLSAKILKIFFKNIKIDYIFYSGFKPKKTERLEFRFSDHYPIISYFSL